MTSIYGWTGQILRVDLTTLQFTKEDTMKYARHVFGGRGIAAQIAWNELSPKIGAFDPENRLIIMSGPLTGTATPGSGRVIFGGIAPQVFPTPRYSRSSMGGHWGAMLKYGGYDGIVVTGRAEHPIYLWIHDGVVEVRDASSLWGVDTYSTQQLLVREHGSDAVAITIGPAGEHLSRIAIVANETENAAGQGGFGAVMGSKNLKAIVVHGTLPLNIASPSRFLEVYSAIHRFISKKGAKVDLCGARVETLVKPQLDLYLGKYSQKLAGCAGCPVACAPGLSRILVNVPGKVYPTLNTSVKTCVESRWIGGTGDHYRSRKGWGIPHPDYHQEYSALPQDLPVLDFEAGFECAVVGNKFGLNMWEITLGLIPWFHLCHKKGLLTATDVGMPIKLDDGAFWCELLRKIAYREGIGDALAEGMPRAAQILGTGREYLTHIAHGFVEHIVGRGIQTTLPFPDWITSALIWATESRDPVSELHSSTRISTSRGLTPQQARVLSQQIYGTEKTVDPTYEYKAPRAIWHQNRGCAKDSLVLCDAVYPIVSSEMTEDRSGFTAAESELVSAITGIELSESDLDHIGERIFNLERAIMVREGRSKEYDLNSGVMTYLHTRPDTDGIYLEKSLFTQSLDEFYQLRGWDIATGWPTESTLKRLNLSSVAFELNKLGRLPR